MGITGYESRRKNVPFLAQMPQDDPAFGAFEDVAVSIVKIDPVANRLLGLFYEFASVQAHVFAGGQCWKKLSGQH